MLKAPAAVSFVQPLIARGTELRTAEPIVAYFCFYQAVKEVLDNKLHTTDAEVSDFATSLLEELEEMKGSGLKSEDAKSILDSDDASRAYVLNFAANVFAKMQAAVDQLNVTKATGAGFMAAATFLALEKVWSPLTPETSEKIKYSKYQAARILAAVKDGKDPNEQFREEAQLAREAEAELDAQPESLPEEPNFEGEAADTLKVSSPGASVSSRRLNSEEPTAPAKASASSISGGEDLDLPAAPNDDPTNDLDLPGPPREDLDNDLSLPEAPADQPEGNASPPLPPKQPPKEKSIPPQSHQPPRPRKPAASPAVKPVSQAVSAAPPGARPNPAEIVELTKATASAQKHAKYAISALNYDDIRTAIGELDAALDVLKLYESQNADR